ncbi:MAG: dihydrolipoyl dehydrogenase [Chloroflexota bacterium]|nr:MAG: dihydrolipoyl dehydrogenase [Chloroflexota bacterium]
MRASADDLNQQDYDVAVLGGGPGGYVAAIRAAQLGMKAVLVEQDKVGGTCLNRGCIPTKCFLETANLLARLRRGQEYALSVENAGLDYPQLLKRTERIVALLGRGVEALLKNNKVALLSGHGILRSPSSLVVRGTDGGEHTIKAANLILATGSSPKAVPGFPFDGKRVINSDHALRLPAVPKSIIIIGAGAVGVEFASVFNDFGAAVTVVEMLPTLVPLEDREIGAELARIYNRRGIQVFTRAKAGNLLVAEDGISLDVEREGKAEALRAEMVLVAVGRSPNTDDFGLEALNVAMERGFVRVDEQQRTSRPGVYAIGDIVGGIQLAHKAMAEGLVAAESIAGLTTEPLDQNRVPRATYSRPEMASVGLTEQEAIDRGFAVKVGRFPFRANSRALIAGEVDGFAKVVSDAHSGEIHGVHLIGPHVTELIAAPTLAKLLESTPWEMGMNVYAHPTLSEVLGEMALDMRGQAIHSITTPVLDRSLAVKPAD